MKKYWTIAILALLLVAYLAGYWPERQRRTALEVQVKTLEGHLIESQARMRLGSLLSRVLVLTEVAAKSNYEQAQELSSTFFDEVRAEWDGAPQPRYRATLERILKARDGVTADLARGEPSVLEKLHQIQVELREAL